MLKQKTVLCLHLFCLLQINSSFTKHIRQNISDLLYRTSRKSDELGNPSKSEQKNAILVCACMGPRRWETWAPA